jgi:Prephenate dehydrogenase
MTIARVAIIGLGLLGGSIGLATKARAPQIVTTGWDRDASVRQRAAARGLVDQVCEHAEGASRRSRSS